MKSKGGRCHRIMASETTPPATKPSEEAQPDPKAVDKEDDTRIVFSSWDTALVPD